MATIVCRPRSDAGRCCRIVRPRPFARDGVFDTLDQIAVEQSCIEWIGSTTVVINANSLCMDKSPIFINEPLEHI